jgi:hypothetical protein
VRRAGIVGAAGSVASALAFLIPAAPSALWVVTAGLVGMMVTDALWRK